MLADVQSARLRECSRNRRAGPHRKPQAALSKEVDEFIRVMSASPMRGGISPSARAALIALIATLAELLGESPLAS